MILSIWYQTAKIKTLLNSNEFHRCATTPNPDLMQGSRRTAIFFYNIYRYYFSTYYYEKFIFAKVIKDCNSLQTFHKTFPFINKNPIDVLMQNIFSNVCCVKKTGFLLHFWYQIEIPDWAVWEIYFSLRKNIWRQCILIIIITTKSF